MLTLTDIAAVADSYADGISQMHYKFKTTEWVANSSPQQLKRLMGLRMTMLEEEYRETQLAVIDKDPEEVIDGLIDLCVIAIGTLDIMGVDVDVAWEEVMMANMAKEVGIKPSRPNPMGLPDLVKPEGWTPPSHADNHGDTELFL